MKKKILLGLGLLLAVMIVSTVTARMSEIGELTRLAIDHIDLANVADGIYESNFGREVLSARLQVTVSNGQIAAISILEPGQGLGKAGQAMIDSILEKQSLQVDVVTGATATSKLMLKTVEEALRQGLR
ncbi:MAG: FMN-binding protein [Bacillota bacterium]|jgi:uncharacterized protein with FMN-binding domain